VADRPTKSKRPEPERVKFTGNWEDLAERIVKQPAGKAPARQTKKRVKKK